MFSKCEVAEVAEGDTDKEHGFCLWKYHCSLSVAQELCCFKAEPCVFWGRLSIIFILEQHCCVTCSVCAKSGAGRGQTLYPVTQLPICFHLPESTLYSASNSLNFSVCSTFTQGAVAAPYCSALLFSCLCLMWCPSIFSPAPDRRWLFFLKVRLNVVSW